MLFNSKKIIITQKILLTLKTAVAGAKSFLWAAGTDVPSPKLRDIS